jgi:hypothetical protein
MRITLTTGLPICIASHIRVTVSVSLGGGSGVVSCFVDEDRYLGELYYPEHIKNFNMVEAKIKSQIDKEGL